MKSIISQTNMNDAKLIDLVEAQPSIYDKTDIFYSNKEHVRSIWRMIAGEMQQEVPVCQKRWRYLRDYFVRQLHITEDNNNIARDDDGGGGGGEKQVATFSGKRSYWPFFDRLSFLKPFSSTRRRMKRSSTEEIVTSQTLMNTHHEDINYTRSICSEEGSDRSRISSSTTVSDAHHLPEDNISNMEFLKFYQAMQMAAQQNFNSNNNGCTNQFPVVECDSSPPSKKKHHESDSLSAAFPLVEYAIDEHDCFFKSILSSVRRISDEHIIAFRTEVLQVLMKFRNLSEATDDDEASDLETGNEEQNDEDDDVVVVNTEEAHWRKNLFRNQF